MLVMFPGEIRVAELERELRPFLDLLKREGLDRVTGLQISFLGWRGNARCQIVDKHNFISEVNFDRSENGEARTVRPGSVIRDRPDDLEFSPFAVMFGHDD